ncbi:MAG: hypothetical protein K2V38_09615, partial [Gemmataceae bacterium]|nr:hypothetical protein [Gemmataceae bacterium]
MSTIDNFRSAAMAVCGGDRTLAFANGFCRPRGAFAAVMTELFRDAESEAEPYRRALLGDAQHPGLDRLDR